jgi:hypothetical protein
MYDSYILCCMLVLFSNTPKYSLQLVKDEGMLGSIQLLWSCWHIGSYRASSVNGVYR